MLGGGVIFGAVGHLRHPLAWLPPREMLNEFDNVATAVSATVPNLFLRIDGEAISAAACRARADHLGTDTFKRDTAAGSFVFEPYGPRVLDFGGGIIPPASARNSY
jgi:hypothetical protein